MAFFSSTDDDDEKMDMLYMVMGTLNQSIPSFSIRARIKGKNALEKIPLEDIFDITQEEFVQKVPSWKTSHEKSWLKLVNPISYCGSASHNFYSGYMPNSRSIYSHYDAWWEDSHRLDYTRHTNYSNTSFKPGYIETRNWDVHEAMQDFCKLIKRHPSYLDDKEVEKGLNDLLVNIACSDYWDAFVEIADAFIVCELEARKKTINKDENIIKDVNTIVCKELELL